MPPVWVSENGMDSSDPRYRGWRAIPLTEQQYATGQLGPMDSYYRTLPQPVLGQSVFVWIGDGLGWGEFQVKNAGLLHELIIADQQAKQEVLPPMSDLQSGSVIVHAVTLNVRSGPARSYEKIGSLARTTGPVAAWIGPERTEDGHVWVYIRVGEIAGWAASSVLGGAVYMTAQVDDAPEPPQEPPEEPQEPGEDVSDLTARVAQLEAELQAEKSARAAGEASNRDRWRALASGIRAGGTWFDELGDAVGDGLPESP